MDGHVGEDNEALGVLATANGAQYIVQAWVRWEAWFKAETKHRRKTAQRRGQGGGDKGENVNTIIGTHIDHSVYE